MRALTSLGTETRKASGPTPPLSLYRSEAIGLSVRELRSTYYTDCVLRIACYGWWVAFCGQMNNDSPQCLPLVLSRWTLVGRDEDGKLL